MLGKKLRGKAGRPGSGLTWSLYVYTHRPHLGARAGGFSSHPGFAFSLKLSNSPTLQLQPHAGLNTEGVGLLAALSGPARLRLLHCASAAFSRADSRSSRRISRTQKLGSHPTPTLSTSSLFNFSTLQLSNFIPVGDDSEGVGLLAALSGPARLRLLHCASAAFSRADSRSSRRISRTQKVGSHPTPGLLFLSNSPTLQLFNFNPAWG
jgi:hypothetical protein